MHSALEGATLHTEGFVFVRLSQLWAGATEEPKAASSGASKSGGTPGAKQRSGKNKRR